MSFRQKLLLLFAATVFLCVAVISASVYSTMRGSFERADQERANAVAAQFRSEFQRRGQEVVRKVESVAASETVQRIALEINRGKEPGPYQNPRVAAVLNLLTHGFGYFYLGERGKGLLVFLGLRFVAAALGRAQDRGGPTGRRPPPQVRAMPSDRSRSAP